MSIRSDLQEIGLSLTKMTCCSLLLIVFAGGTIGGIIALVRFIINL